MNEVGLTHVRSDVEQLVRKLPVQATLARVQALGLQITQLKNKFGQVPNVINVWAGERSATRMMAGIRDS